MEKKIGNKQERRNGRETGIEKERKRALVKVELQNKLLR